MSAVIWFQIALEFCGNSFWERYPMPVAATYALVAPKVVAHSAEEEQELFTPRAGQDIAIEVHNLALIAADQREHPLVAEIVRADGVVVQSGSVIARRNWLGRFDATIKLAPVSTAGRYGLRLIPTTVADPPIPITTMPQLTGRSTPLTVNVASAE